MNQKTDLSLLPSQAKFRLDKMKWLKRNRIIMMTVAGIWLLIMIIVIGLNVWGGMVLAKAKKDYSLATRDMSGMADSVVTSQNLKYNAKLLGRVLSSRFEYGKAFKTIVTLFPEGITLDEFKLDDKRFVVKGEAIGKNVDILEKLTDKINTGSDDRFNKFKIIDLALNNGVWQFESEVELK